MMYTFIAESSSGAMIKETTLVADCYLDARRLFWRGLTDEQRNSCACVECVNEIKEVIQ